MKLRKLLTLVSTLGLCLVTNFTFSLAHAETGFGDDYKDDHEPTKIECGNDDVFDDWHQVEHTCKNYQTLFVYGNYFRAFNVLSEWDPYWYANEELKTSSGIRHLWDITYEEYSRFTYYDKYHLKQYLRGSYWQQLGYLNEAVNNVQDPQAREFAKALMEISGENAPRDYYNYVVEQGGVAKSNSLFVELESLMRDVWRKIYSEALKPPSPAEMAALLGSILLGATGQVPSKDVIKDLGKEVIEKKLEENKKAEQRLNKDQEVRKEFGKKLEKALEKGNEIKPNEHSSVRTLKEFRVKFDDVISTMFSFGKLTASNLSTAVNGLSKVIPSSKTVYTDCAKLYNRNPNFYQLVIRCYSHNISHEAYKVLLLREADVYVNMQRHISEYSKELKEIEDKSLKAKQTINKKLGLSSSSEILDKDFSGDTETERLQTVTQEELYNYTANSKARQEEFRKFLEMVGSAKTQATDTVLSYLVKILEAKDFLANGKVNGDNLSQVTVFCLGKHKYSSAKAKLSTAEFKACNINDYFKANLR